MTDTYTNTVSYRIVSSVLESYKQDDSRIGATAGVQCACPVCNTHCLHYVG